MASLWIKKQQVVEISLLGQVSLKRLFTNFDILSRLGISAFNHKSAKRLALPYQANLNDERQSFSKFELELIMQSDQRLKAITDCSAETKWE